MKPTLKRALPCAVFGHNYIKSKTYADHTAELSCCHCNTVVKTDIHGNFEEFNITNKDIQSTLRQLFHLKLQISKPNFLDNR
ncbi:hypothetical protein [Winogradskyella luteola]|uniref:Prophage protein n=1 Tax=Winogradskyella luteola TaxID=2828330 RepID=A0A9X1JNR2_9FLAO|nr:hypothetical protein [Winogradskyella luteola]MBV7269666.1 hypothetical protein [Winogradskyella luteola]